MVKFPAFGLLLARLLDHRGTTIASLSQAADVPESELRDVLGGGEPAASLLTALAPPLGLHAADVFAMAGHAVPDALAPLDASARGHIGPLVMDAICLPAEQRAELRRMVDDLPQAPRTLPFTAVKTFDPREAGFGAMLGNMLYGNRNLGWSGAARALACCSNGRMYVSLSTIGQIVGGRVPLTGERLAGLGTLLDLPAGDLAAITGIPLPDGSSHPDPAAADMAALLWGIRRLTAGQVRDVRDRAGAMRSEIPDDAIDRHFYAMRSHETSRGTG